MQPFALPFWILVACSVCVTTVIQAAPPAKSPAAGSPPRRSLADLAAQGKLNQFKLPMIEEGKLAVAGIRKLTGQHITLYTDLAPAADVDELPTVFDAAVPQICAYCGIDPQVTAEWRIVGYVMKDKERFEGTGLYPADLPAFPHGYSRGSEIWLYDQPSAYYRRHLMIHEGVHAFMYRFLDGAGPPWYMEGVAELLGTHKWEAPVENAVPGVPERHGVRSLQLGYMPRSKEEVPYWGRVKIVRDEYAAGRGMSLVSVMKYDAHAHLRNEPYGWCWAAAAFFDQHPLTHKAFRKLPTEAHDRSIDFSRRFYEALHADWRSLGEDWQLFVLDMDYGYDVARAAIVRKAAVPLPAAGATIEIAADRGWQSTGLRLEAGRSYSLIAGGQYQVGKEPRPWICEPGGVTLRYHNGKPLGILLAAVVDENDSSAPFARPQSVGLQADLQPTAAGTLYLRINESAAGLFDNSGKLSVQVRAR